MGINVSVNKFKEFSASVQSVLDVFAIVNEMGDVEKEYNKQMNELSRLKAEAKSQELYFMDAQAKVIEAEEKAKAVASDAKILFDKKVKAAEEEAANIKKSAEEVSDNVRSSALKALDDARVSAQKIKDDAVNSISALKNEIEDKKKALVGLDNDIKKKNKELDGVMGHIEDMKSKFKMFAE